MNNHTLHTKNSLNDSNIGILEDNVSIKYSYVDDDFNDYIEIQDDYNIDFYEQTSKKKNK